MLTFETGASALSFGFVANASVEAEPDGKSTLIVNVQHKNGKDAGLSFNAGDRMGEKFYKQVEEELARQPSQKAVQKPESSYIATPANSNGADGKPVASSAAAQFPADLGTVSISSSPDGGDISVDGAFVGSSPAVLKLRPGKHTISVAVDGYKSWSRDLTILSGADTKLNPSLSKP